MTQKNEQAIDERERALAEQIQRELDNSNLNKFLNNVEARIYAEMSKQLVDAIFGDNPSESGVIELGGNTIEYRNDGVDVYLTITDQDGNTTEIVVPYGTLGIG
jgi:curli production assembly/transport component CsgF